MDVMFSIRVNSTNYLQILSLQCVLSGKSFRKKNGPILVSLRPEDTKGRILARNGDFLVQFASGKWQVFGSESYYRLILKNDIEI